MSSDLSLPAALNQAWDLMHQGRADLAIELFQRLILQAPDNAETWLQFGLLLLQLGQWSDASIVLRQATARNSQLIIAWDAFGVALREQGQLHEAESCARQAIALAEEMPIPWLNLGCALYGQLRWAEAAAAFQRSIERDPNSAMAWSHLGAAELVQNHFSAATAALERSISLGSRDLVTRANLSLVLANLGDTERARQIVEAVRPEDVRGAREWTTLGNVFHTLDQLDRAADAYGRALAIAPGHPQAIQNLAILQEARGRYFEAEQYVRRILHDNPQSAEAWSLLSGLQHAQADHLQAIASGEKSLSIEAHPVRHSRLLQFLQYADVIGPGELLAAHQRWNAIYGEPFFPTQAPFIAPSSGGKLRLGFVSSDFGTHPIAFLTLSALEMLNRSEFEITCYSDRLLDDEYTNRFRAAAAFWRRTIGWSDEQLAEQIRNDRIDVLFDLAGHHGKRLLVFARRPAPMQISWAGYVGTTGLRAMDGLIADRFHVRPGEEKYFVETVLRMPADYVCYGPPGDAPAAGPLPAAKSGRVTFGCFNNPAKYSAQMFDAWAAILSRVADSQLLLKFRGLDDEHNRARILREFASRGIDARRLVLAGWTPLIDSLAAYNRIDLALDTAHYSGGLTTCEALWMGVPVITFPGRTFAGRHSTSHLTNVGLEQFVARDAAGFVDLAVEWSRRLDDLAVLRGEMRERVRHSPLCDAPRFARDFQSLLNQVLKR
jgi:protein O-GlcNAc transferase